MIDDHFTEEARQMVRQHLLLHNDPVVRAIARDTVFPSYSPTVAAIAAHLRRLADAITEAEEQTS